MTKLSGRSLLILELSILLAFFLFAAVTCTYMFVKASGEAKDAEALGKAVVKTTSIAETLKATDGSLSKSGSLLGEKSSYAKEGDTLTLYMGSDMNPSSKSAAAYTASVTKKKQGLMWDFDILIRDNEDSTVVYELEFNTIRGEAKGK